MKEIKGEEGVYRPPMSYIFLPLSPASPCPEYTITGDVLLSTITTGYHVAHPLPYIAL